MPLRPPKYCPRCRTIGCSPGCRQRAEQFRLRSIRERDKRRPNSAQRGYSGQWIELRQRVIARDGCCRECGSTRSLHVDHITPRAQGGSDHQSNLQVLCHSCHSRKTARHDQVRR